MLTQPKAIGGLGFRDLCKCNEAMLTKQVWILLYNTDSLFYRIFFFFFLIRFYRIFKAKYSMQNCLRVIYAWKSILKASRLLHWVQSGGWGMGL